MFDYGTLENRVGVDPNNSRTGMSNPLTFVPQAINKEVASRVLAGLFIEDDSTRSELVAQFWPALTFTSELRVYDVVFGGETGTSSIVQVNQMTVPTFRTLLGVRRVDSDLFYGYNVRGTGITSDFTRYEMSSGTSTTTLITSVTIPDPPSGFTYYSFGGASITVGKKVYSTIITNSIEFITGVGDVTRKMYFYTYCFDMALETATLISSIILPTLSGNDDYSVASIYLAASLGGISYDIVYAVDRVTPYTPPYRDKRDYYSLIGGASTLLLTYESTAFSITGASRSGRYNYKNWVSVTNVHTDLGDDFYIKANEDGIALVDVDSFPDVVSPITFVSLDTYPHVGVASSEFYWLDGNGKILDPITLSGVDYLHNVYPTLDTDTGSIYMTAHMLDGTDQLLLVDSVSKTIVSIITIQNSPWGLESLVDSTTFNHGNFFLHYFTSTPGLYITYIDKVPSIFGLNDSLMLEKN